MENPEKLKLTSDEMDRLGKALKDERFRDMLHEYVQEISDPETRRQYEEEMTLLEQQRGNNIEFLHPTPFKALKTSVDGKNKCFINICASDKVGKPECKIGASEDGRRGQHWTLPHSLLPGRQDTDPKGNKVIIYDVVFHPDTLHIASKDKRFMDLVVSTAVNGIQNTLKVTLDKNNVRQMNTKYKGTPQPCVIRKPISGFKAEETPENPDPLTFPLQDEIRPNTTHNSDSKPVQVQPQEASAPTKPRFTVKYRTFVDLQDFRHSRDSATSPRPKEIVVTIDLPLLKSVKDTNLDVRERSLLLESKKPAYRLELPLAYPVDEDKGQAKFNKQRGQLTVTLPVLPSTEAWDSAVVPSQGSVGDDNDDKENERGSVGRGEEQELKQQIKLGEDQVEDREEQGTKELEGEQNVEGDEEREEQRTKVLEGEEQNVEGDEEREEQITKVLEGEKQNVEHEERVEKMTKVLEGEEQNVQEREEQMTKVLEGEKQNIEHEERVEKMTKVLEGEKQNLEGEEREEQMRKVLEGEKQNVEGEEEQEEQMTKVLEGEEQNVEGEEEREEQITKVLEVEKQHLEPEEELEEHMRKVLEGEEQNVEREEKEEPRTKVLEGEEQNVEGEEEREEQMKKVLEGEEQNVEREEERDELEGEDLGKGVKGQEEKCNKQRRAGEESEGVVINVEEATWKKQNRESVEERGGVVDPNLGTIYDDELEEDNVKEDEPGQEEVAVNLNAMEMKTPHVTGETENTKENVKAEEADESVSGPGKQDEGEETDEDDLQTEQVFHTKEPEAALLREKDGDGNEKVIRDHSTSAGFVFQNKLIYMLD